MTNEGHTPKDPITQQPDALKEALVEMEAEMLLYKEGIIAGTLTLTPEAALRFQDAIKDLSDRSTLTIDDVTYHTEQLKGIRVALDGSLEGGSSSGSEDNQSSPTSD